MFKLYDNDDYVNADGLYAFSDVEIKDTLDYYYGNFGFMNESGEIVIPAQYLYASQFSNGYAVVCTKWEKRDSCEPYYKEFNYIDKTGRIVFEQGFFEAHDFNLYGVAAVWRSPDIGTMCLIDKEGNEIEGTFFNHIGEYSNPEDRYFQFHSLNDFEGFFWDPPIGLYDTKERKAVFDEKYSDIEVINDDMFLVDEYTGKNPFDTQQKYINSKGEPLFKQQIGKGFCTVSIPNNYGYSIVSLVEYKLLPDTAASWVPIDGKKYERIRQYGVIDSSGEFVIQPKYERIKDLSEGRYECILFDEAEPTIIDVLTAKIQTK